MNIVFVSTWHRRTLGIYYPRAASRLNHRVCTVGPWDAEQTFGTRGREPDVPLPTKTPPWYAYDEVVRGLPWKPDVLWLLEGGEDLRVIDVPSDVPFVHQSTEVLHMEWSRLVTPHRYVNFTCNGFAPPDVKWLPYGFDTDDAGGAYIPMRSREYDCAQVGSARQSRVLIWDHLRRAKDVHCWFSGSLWGPAHFALYRNARSTFCNQTHDFACPRVFDAMGMGCLLISDRVPSIMSLFEDGKHFVGYDRVMMPGGEGIPDPDWILDTVRRCRREPDWASGIAQAARELAWAKHTYTNRVAEVLGAI